MSFKLCSSGAIIALAGAAANPIATASGSANDPLVVFSNLIEGEIGLMTQFDWITNIDEATTAQTSGALALVAAAGAALMVVDYDPTGYLDTDAETKRNYLYDRYITGLQRLQDKDGRHFMENGEAN